MTVTGYFVVPPTLNAPIQVPTYSTKTMSLHKLALNLWKPNQTQLDISYIEILKPNKATTKYVHLID